MVMSIEELEKMREIFKCNTCVNLSFFYEGERLIPYCSAHKNGWVNLKCDDYVKIRGIN